MGTPGELLHGRLKAFLLFLKPKLAVGGFDQDRLANLRRLSDVRLQKFTVNNPRVTGADLCGLLADPRTGRFDDLAEEVGLLTKPLLSVVLPMMEEDMGYLVEVCLTHQVLGTAALKAHAAAFVAQHGTIAAPPAPAAAPAASTLAPGVARLLSSLSDLWTLPPPTLKALQLLADAGSPSDAVCAEIDRAPGLGPRVLRLVGAASLEKPASLRRAMLALGYPLLRRHVLTAALASKLDPPFPEAGFDARSHWRRSLTFAHAAAKVSRLTRVGNPDEHYFAGLLHDLGRLAAAKAGGPSPDAPLGDVGAAILERWRFPAAVIDAARHHGDPPEGLRREAAVVAALRSFAENPSRPPSGPLKSVAEPVASVLEAAAASAQAGLEELFS